MGSTAAYQSYQEALKQGQKEFKNCVHRGQYPYIQSLWRIQEDSAQLSRVPLGVLEIPAYLIVGSTEDQRCSSFSPSFYPLLAAKSEFALKWMALCEIQLEEGIRDPIRCYEYLGHFYVMEGNKRVSVLKAMGADFLLADVTRLLPAEADNITVQIYQEFLEFYRCSGFYGLHFSERGGYAKLQAAFGYAKDGRWPEAFRTRFQACYFRFRTCFYGLGGGNLGLTTGDALLLWLRFYSTADFLSMDEEAYRQSLSAVWKELSVNPGANPVLVGEAPAVLGKKTTRPFSRPKPLRVAFLFQRTPEESSWTAAHDRGREYLERAMGDQVAVAAYYNVPVDEGGEARIAQAAEEGAELIFTTNAALLPASLRAAVKYPKVQIMNCSIDQPYVNVRAYYSRVYEGKFITGAIAGALCRDGRIGYVGSYPILGVPASINAFALGAALTNPEARIELRWYCMPGDCREEFRRRGIRLISDRDGGPDHVKGAMGLFRYGAGGVPVPLASPVWNWGEFYVRIVRELLGGRRRMPGEEGAKAVNYWWGMSSGVVDLQLSPDLPEGVQTLARILKQGIQAETIQPFQRTIVTQSGVTINDGSRNLSMEEILKMNWLCDRVEGRIPTYEEVLPAARATVRQLGIDRESIPPEEGEL